MVVRVRLSEPLSQYAMNKKNVTIRACSNVSQAFEELGKLYPGMERRILDDQDNVRRYVNVFLNGDLVTSSPETVRLKENDELYIVQSVAGG